MNRERDNAQKIWLVIDELASLGKLPSLPKLMQEGRKYGGCIIASTQSTSQLYHNYGEADASNLIGLFRTKFAFSSDDPKMGELYSKLSGTSTIIQQQKNTSFGANEFRDGVSYNEKRENIPLIPYDAFTKLGTGECFVFLPEQTVRLSKIQVAKTKIKDKNSYFIEGQNERGNIAEVSNVTTHASQSVSKSVEPIPQGQLR
jgi:type IV secretory pathway TraG/TraD family ATPase VirD4